MCSIASSTSHRWLASIISLASGPISSRMISAARLTSSSRETPTFILKADQPLGDRPCTGARSLSSEYPSHAAEVVYAG